MSTVILYMIVKNEAHVIERALKSVIPHIHGWAVCDTGSTDGTQNVIQRVMDEAGIPGKLQQDEWVDFATNRNRSLELARTLGDENDYALVLDADSYFEFDDGFQWPALVRDSYYIQIEETATHYRPDLVRLGAAWKWFGVLHEYSGPTDGSTVHEGEVLPGLRGGTKFDGARHADSKATYAKDAALIEAALAVETNPVMQRRYQFYLAQSYGNSDQWELSTANYIKRTQMSDADDEVYVSFLRAAMQASGGLSGPEYSAEELFKKAIEVDSDRAEARFYLSCLYSFDERHQEAYDIIRPVLFKRPPIAMMVDAKVYEIGVSDQFSSAAYWVGDYKGCIEQCLNLLMLHPELELPDRKRIAKNAWRATLKLHGIAEDTGKV